MIIIFFIIFFFLFSLPMQVIILLQKLPLANTREMVYSFFTYSREITRLLFHILKMMSFFPTHIFFSSSLSPSFFKLSIWFSHFPFHFWTHCYLVNCQPERNICCVYSIAHIYLQTVTHTSDIRVEQTFCQCRLIQINVKFCVINHDTLARYNPGKTREWILHRLR